MKGTRRSSWLFEIGNLHHTVHLGTTVNFVFAYVQVLGVLSLLLTLHDINLFHCHDHTVDNNRFSTSLAIVVPFTSMHV